MTNHEKFHIEAFGLIKGPEHLKELQADIRRLPNFGGRGVCATRVTNREFWAILKDKRTGEIWSYFGSRESFNAWGQERALSDSAAEMDILRVSCWICGDNPVRNPRCELTRVNPKGDIGVWECQKCHEGTRAEGSTAPPAKVQ